MKDGVARLQESGALAGSTLKYAHGLKNVHRLTGKPLSDLVKATSWNQAQSLGLEGLGKIAPGFTADMVLLDDDFNTARCSSTEWKIQRVTARPRAGRDGNPSGAPSPSYRIPTFNIHLHGYYH